MGEAKPGVGVSLTNRTSSSLVWRLSEHDIEAGSVAGLPGRPGGKLSGHQGSLVIGYPAIQEIRFVARLTLDIDLRDQDLSTLEEDCRMNVRGSPRIGHRVNRAKTVSALSVGKGMSVALKIWIGSGFPPVPRVVVAASGVTLPNLDPCPSDRISTGIQQPAIEIG